MSFMEWVDELFRGDGSTGSPGGGTAGQFALGQYASQVPYIGTYLGYYLTGREDLSDLTSGLEDFDQAVDGPSERRDRKRDRDGGSQDSGGWPDSFQDTPGENGRRRSDLRSPDLLADNSSSVGREAWKDQPERWAPVRQENMLDTGGPIDIVVIRGARPPRRSHAPMPRQPTARPPVPVQPLPRRNGRVDIDPFETQGLGLQAISPDWLIPPLLAPEVPEGNAHTPLPQPFQWNRFEYVPAGRRTGVMVPVRPERDFYDRGGTGLLIGSATATLAVILIVSNPVGWVAGVAALLFAAGVAATATSSVELGMSYSGRSTAEQDAAANQATGVVLALGTPGGLVGGVTGLVVGGDLESLETGALIGGFGEGLAPAGRGAGRIVQMERRFGRNPPNMAWTRDLADRNRNALGVAGGTVRMNPAFPRGRELLELSHFLPKNPRTGVLYRVRRTFGNQRYWRLVNRPWNLRPMSALEHALVDPQRFQFIKRAHKTFYEGQRLRGIARLGALAPRSLKDLGFGATMSGRTLVVHSYFAEWDRVGVVLDTLMPESEDADDAVLFNE